MKKVMITAAAVALITSPALAKDFTGPLLGLSLGHAWGDVEYDYEDGTTGFGDFSEEDDMSGFEGSIFAGYRHQFPSGFVLGGEVGYGLSNADGSYSLTVSGNTATVDFEKNHQFYADLKPGYVLRENLLAYALIGYQRTEFESEAFLNGASLGNTDDDFDAWRFGVGAEYMLKEKFSVRGQYYHASYSDNDYSDDNGQVETWGGDENVFEIGFTAGLRSLRPAVATPHQLSSVQRVSTSSRNQRPQGQTDNE